MHGSKRALCVCVLRVEIDDGNVDGIMSRHSVDLG